ncbi:hypothetical protein EON83_10175 [bacterium]|nr:MAG: hypothetical protein EON83_10175 [bacterium]
MKPSHGPLKRASSHLHLFTALTFLVGAASAAPTDALKSEFVSPPNSSKPWVYWYFNDGWVNKVGMKGDLEAMKKAGLGGGIFFEIGQGIARGPVQFMSPEWLDNFAYGVRESQRLGLQLGLASAPGWTGSGGPWITPEQSMQHLVGSETSVSGPSNFDAVLPRPKPREPWSGLNDLTASLRQQWEGYYRDEVVLAFPTPAKGTRIDDTDHKALYYRAPYSSVPGVPPRIPAPASFPLGDGVPLAGIVDLTSKLGPDGHLKWEVPAGNWTILRFGRTTAGRTTAPAPAPGLGFESDKFSETALEKHLDAYVGAILNKIGPDYRKGDSGLTMLHFDSWEMGAQNWTQGFKTEFIKRRGYDPTAYLPTMIGYVIGSPERSERFLWDLRQTANELVLEKHAAVMAKYAHNKGLTFSVEPYDLNPSSDLDLGAYADVPSAEFWSHPWSFPTEFSCFEAASIAHVNGRSTVGAESFTALWGEDWKQYPGSMKNQLDWALCTGINKIVFHRYANQPNPGQLPGMTMGPFGVHWEATQTWWDMVPAFHQYISRSSNLLRKGASVADVLYLTPEGAPQVFTPPPSALTGEYPDHKGYNFDGCSPKTLMAKAKVESGRIVFPGGATYRLLVLPSWDTMTPQLLQKITALVEAGATVIGAPPLKSPSLVGYPACDDQIATLASRLWGKAPYASRRKVGKGLVVYNAFKATPPLQGAQWIWSQSSNAIKEAPLETLYFSKDFELDSKTPLASAVATFHVDNDYELTVNGQKVGQGSDFHTAPDYDIASLLRAGHNEVTIKATNTGDGMGGKPNPAGVLGAVTLTFVDGKQRRFVTGADWSVATKPNGTRTAVEAFAAANSAPWNIADKPAAIYPDYAVTANLLQSLGTSPDFSATAPMRFIHRRLQKGDLYFVANSSGTTSAPRATFRVVGLQPEWWNPVSGESRDLTDFKVSGASTTIPLKLAPYESGFVIFRKPLAAKVVSSPNFESFKPIQALTKPWNVAFDPKWGAPASITFPTLEDWSTRSEPAIKYYSGKAVYTTTFDLPSTIASTTKVAINLGTVKNMASVKLNGKDLGVVWCDPWRASAPAGILKPTDNRLEVTVANLWVNRLIGDEFLPDSQRQTQTTLRPYRQNSPLQPSGLLGPVTLERVEQT